MMFLMVLMKDEEILNEYKLIFLLVILVVEEYLMNIC